MSGIKEVGAASDYEASIALLQGYNFIKSRKTGIVFLISGDDNGNVIYTEVDREGIVE